MLKYYSIAYWQPILIKTQLTFKRRRNSNQLYKSYVLSHKRNLICVFSWCWNCRNTSMEQMTSRSPLQPIFFYDFIAEIETSLD